MGQKIRTLDLLAMHAVFIIVALGTVASKAAAGETMLSFKWIILYGLNIASLGVYALLWQQILKRVPLTLAFSNKAVTIVWGLVFGAIFFHESITWLHILAAALVMGGVVLVVTEHE